MKKRMGSGIDDFLKEEGIFEEAQAQAVKEVVAWQLAQGHERALKILSRIGTDDPPIPGDELPARRRAPRKPPR
jgi:hypothetical protein